MAQPALARGRTVFSAFSSFSAAVLCSLLLGGCAALPGPPPSATHLLHDELFPAAPAAIDAAQVFALSPRMREVASAARRSAGTARDLRQTLLQALTARDGLRLEYDDGQTRTAAEAFERRAGNCLSLVLMTAAFAKHLDMPVRYQAVQVRPFYSRSSGLTLASGHINVVLAGRTRWTLDDTGRDSELTVDFVPPADLRGAVVQPLAETTVLAMFMNNRAAETLAAGRADAAYAWARQALRLDPAYLPGINTLAVVYQRAGRPAAAEAALRHVLAQRPDDEAALSNLAGLLRAAGRDAEADAVAAQLARVQPYPPFHFLDLGRAALHEGRAEQARELIGRELRRQPYQHEAHFWAAVVDDALGDAKAAEAHLRQAVEYSGSPQLQARYGAKLAHLRATGQPH